MYYFNSSSWTRVPVHSEERVENRRWGQRLATWEGVPVLSSWRRHGAPRRHKRGWSRARTWGLLGSGLQALGPLGARGPWSRGGWCPLKVRRRRQRPGGGDRSATQLQMEGGHHTCYKLTRSDDTLFMEWVGPTDVCSFPDAATRVPQALGSARARAQRLERAGVLVELELSPWGPPA